MKLGELLDKLMEVHPDEWEKEVRLEADYGEYEVTGFSKSTLCIIAKIPSDYRS